MKTTCTNVPATQLHTKKSSVTTCFSLAAISLLLLLGLTGCYGVISSKSSGTATNPTAALTATPATLSFGDVALGSDGTQTSTLKNTGNSDVTVTGVTASSPAFMVSGVPGGTTLSSGQSTVLTVTFK